MNSLLAYEKGEGCVYKLLGHLEYFLMPDLSHESKLCGRSTCLSQVPYCPKFNIEIPNEVHQTVFAQRHVQKKYKQ